MVFHSDGEYENRAAYFGQNIRYRIGHRRITHIRSEALSTGKWANIQKLVKPQAWVDSVRRSTAVAPEDVGFAVGILIPGVGV